METGDKQDDTFQKTGQPIWEIHAGISLPGWPWKSLMVEHSYLQKVEGQREGEPTSYARYVKAIPVT